MKIVNKICQHAKPAEYKFDANISTFIVLVYDLLLKPNSFTIALYLLMEILCLVCQVNTQYVLPMPHVPGNAWLLSRRRSSRSRNVVQ